MRTNASVAAAVAATGDYIHLMWNRLAHVKNQFGWLADDDEIYMMYT